MNEMYNMAMAMKILEHSSILDVEEGIICHQVNCIGVMKAGLAKQVKARWPDVFKQYASLCQSCKDMPGQLLGKVQDIAVSDKLVIANCFGQVYPGNGLMTCYEAWKHIITQLLDAASYFGSNAIHLPYMVGCGLAGGDWKVMSEVLENGFKGHDVEVMLHKL